MLPSESSCVEVLVPGNYTCAQQRDFGKCGADFMVGFCDVTCGRCTTSLQDSARLGEVTHFVIHFVMHFALLVLWQSFLTTHPFVLEFAECLHFALPPEAACVDTPPPASTGAKFTCAQQKSFGKCNAAFMAGYCKVTCGRCTTAPKPTLKPTAKRALITGYDSHSKYLCIRPAVVCAFCDCFACPNDELLHVSWTCSSNMR